MGLVYLLIGPHPFTKFSSSVEVIQELIEVQPLALEMYDTLNRIPLFAVSANLNPNAADILQVFIDSNTATIEDLAEDDVVPFYRFFTAREQGSLVRDEIVLKLVEAFPDSIYLPTSWDLHLINVAAISLTLPAFQVNSPRFFITLRDSLYEYALYYCVFAAYSRNGLGSATLDA